MVLVEYSIGVVHNLPFAAWQLRILDEIKRPCELGGKAAWTESTDRCSTRLSGLILPEIGFPGSLPILEDGHKGPSIKPRLSKDTIGASLLSSSDT